MTEVTERLAQLARSIIAERFAVRDAPFFSEAGIGATLFRLTR